MFELVSLNLVRIYMIQLCVHTCILFRSTMVVQLYTRVPLDLCILVEVNLRCFFEHASIRISMLAVCSQRTIFKDRVYLR